MDQSIRTVVYPVKDFAKAKVFFRELLGVEPYADEPYYVGFRLATRTSDWIQTPTRRE